MTLYSQLHRFYNSCLCHVQAEEWQRLFDERINAEVLRAESASAALNESEARLKKNNALGPKVAPTRKIKKNFTFKGKS